MYTFSIIMPTYNVENFIEKSLTSIVTQKYKSFEIIIIDSISDDKTLEIVRTYKELYREYKWIIISEKDNGIYDAMNKGIKLATGKFIFFLGADDVFYSKNVLEIIYQESKLNRNIDIFYGNIIRVNNQIPNESKLVIPFKLYNNVVFNKIQVFINLGICHQSIFAKKETLENGFSNDYKLASDFNWILESISQKIKFKYTDNIIAKYNISGASSEIKTLFYELKQIFKKHYGSFFAVVFKILRKKRWLKS
jgi:glycosyltransferase involved in cell wall biosynthesis